MNFLLKKKKNVKNSFNQLTNYTKKPVALEFWNQNFFQEKKIIRWKSMLRCKTKCEKLAVNVGLN